MIDRNDVMDAFFQARRTLQYPLAANEIVLVKQGRKSGELAGVIAIESPASDVRYLLEYGDRSDEVISLTHLEPQNPNQSPQPTR